ncbi:MAG: hypothetical protein ACAI25_05305 [Planctomycetota bacterium]
MFSESVARLKPYFEKGVISSFDMANQLLSELTFPRGSTRPLPRGDLDAELPAGVEKLPTAVRQDFIELLTRVRDERFVWSQFLVGGRPVPADPERLREICKALGLSEPDR